MNATAFLYPSVVSWGENRLDYFHIGKENAAHHKYWDGTQWVRTPSIICHSRILVHENFYE
jgi:hypothetical protein